MNKLKVLLITPLLVLSTLLGVPAIHAQGGTVCVTDSTLFPADCSTAPFTFGGPVGSQLTVAVNIQGSDAANGFDIQVFADTSFLRAAEVSTSISFANSIFPSPVIGLECINGILVAGQVCSASDGLGVVHVIAGQGAIVPATVTGRLFSITYTVTGQTGGTPITLPSVRILNGNVVDSETPVSGTFVNLSDFTLTLSPGSQSFVPGSSSSLMANFGVLGSFSDSLTLVTSVSPSTGLTVTCPLSVVLPPSQSLTCSLVSAATVPSPTTFTVTLNATGQTTMVTHSAMATVIVSVPDFLVTASPTDLTIDRGFSDSSAITITALSGFSNTVNLAATSSSSSVAVTVMPNTFPSASGSATVQIMVAAAAAYADYQVTVTGTSTGAGPAPHSATITVHVLSPDFVVIAVNSAIVTLPPLSAVSTVIVTSLHQFQGTLSLSTILTPNGLSSPTVAGNTTGTFVPGTVNPVVAPMTVTLTPGGSAITSLTITTVTGAALGNYTIAVQASNSTVTRSAGVALTLEDFLVSLESNHMVSIPGTSKAPSSFGRVFVDGFSLGGYTGFGNFGGLAGFGNQYIGLPCTRGLVIPRVNLALGRSIVATSCYLLNTGTIPLVFFANGTAVPEAFLFAHGPYVQCVTNEGGSNFCALIPLPPQFGSAICASDAIGLNPDCSDFGFYRAIPFADTLPGDYIIRVAGVYGAVRHPLPDITIHIPAPPQFNQFNWSHRLSFSKSGGVQTFRTGITNVDTQTTLYVNIQIKGFFADGSVAFVANSMTTNGVIALAPGQTVNNIFITVAINPLWIGRTLTFSAVVQYGLSPMKLSATSTSVIVGGPPISGSFTIVP